MIDTAVAEKPVGTMHYGSIDSKTSAPGRVFRAMKAERRVIDWDGSIVRKGGYFTDREIRQICEPCDGECYAASTIVSAVRLQLAKRDRPPGEPWLEVPYAEWQGSLPVYRIIEHLPAPADRPRHGADFTEERLL
jgi:hypothetical protein